MIKTTINQVNFVGNNTIYFNKLNNNKIIKFYEKNKKQKYRVVDMLNTSIINDNDIINKSQLIDYLNTIIKNGKLNVFLVQKINNAKVSNYVDYISIDRLERLKYLIGTKDDNDKLLAIYLLVNNYLTDIFLQFHKV